MDHRPSSIVHRLLFIEEPMMLTHHELLDFALDAAWEAGRITLGYYQTRLDHDRKGDNTPVTVADKEAERKLRQLITGRYPDHAIIGEEFAAVTGNGRYTWVLDPIDGTKSFVSGVPLYSTLVALLEEDEPLLGIIHMPALNETIYALRGEGCYWNGRRARTSTVDKLADARLLVSGLNYFGPKQDAWERLLRATYFQRTWGDAYGYALVATGRAEIMLDAALAPWDAGPLRVIMEEAGGTFTDWQGRPVTLATEGMATNGHLLTAIMDLIHK
jgi:histidinol-phosphatase